MPADELKKLVERLLAGDKSVVDVLASSHIRMIINIARKLSRGKDFEDAVSVGLEGMLEAIDKFSIARTTHQGDNKGITAYIAGVVRNKIIKYRVEDTAIRVPWESQRRLKIKPLINMLAESTTESNNIIEVNEILKVIAQDPFEQVIIKLRRRGFNDVAIAERLGVSVPHIHSIRTKLEKKFFELWSK